jgi:hypothetical protein
MCLIAYVPSGKTLPLENIRAAHFANDDGIGIMCKEGIYKYLGKKALKKAIKQIAILEDAKIEYAVHFRYKTHGDVILQNCHPFKTPNGAAYVMHNGVLSSCGYTEKATKEMSDTAVFVKEFLTEVPEDNNMDYWSSVARHIGWSNKLCVMTHDYKFILVHGDAGTYRDGIWYSQTYSLPYPKSKFISGYHSTGARPNYYTPIERSREWPYHIIDCSCQTCAADRADGELPSERGKDRSDGHWANRNPNWFDELKKRQKKNKVPTSIVTDSLRKALDRRYGIADPRFTGGMRRTSTPLRLTHNPTALQSLAAAIPGIETETQSTITEDSATTRTKAEDNQLDAALRAHLARIDDEGGNYAELELDVSTKGDLLPGWSELNTGSLE